MSGTGWHVTACAVLVSPAAGAAFRRLFGSFMAALDQAPG